MDKIIAIEDGTGWGIYTNLSSHYHCLRNSLKESSAKSLAAQLNKLVNCTLMDVNCPYCHGLGGCYNCNVIK